MNPEDLIRDLRSRINPAYSDQPGTESYERRLCAEALEAQAAEIERLREHAVVLANTERYAERERCASLCEDQDTGDFSLWSMAVQECARLIRAAG